MPIIYLRDVRHPGEPGGFGRLLDPGDSPGRISLPDHDRTVLDSSGALESVD
jgi:hypothetical protein